MSVPHSFPTRRSSDLGTLPAGLSLNSTTGAVTGTATASGSFSIKVTGSVDHTATLFINAINLPLSLSYAATLVVTQGVAYNSGPMSVTGGTPGYTYTVVGTLPAGLSLNSTTGAVTGTATASGSFNINVTDSLGATATGCVITINPPLSLTFAATLTGTQGVAYNSGPMSVTGGTPGYTYSLVGTLPAGLSLNTTTGAVTGTATAS